MSKHTIYINEELEEAMRPYRNQLNLSEILQMGLRRELKYLTQLDSAEGIKSIILESWIK